MFTFIPDASQDANIKVPFIEDARADFAPFYSTTKNIKQAQSEVEKSLAKLGGSVYRFQQGKFDVNNQWRFGYLINFRWRGAEGQIVVAGLPIRKHTEAKENKVRIQALLNVAQWLQSLMTQEVFSPNSNPLVPYLLASDGKTIMQHILESKAIPLLSSFDDAFDAEWIES